MKTDGLRKIKDFIFSIRNIIILFLENILLPFLIRVRNSIIQFIRKLIQYSKELILKTQALIKKCRLHKKLKIFLVYFRNNIGYAFIYFYSDILRNKKFYISFITALLVLIIWSLCFNLFYSRHTWEGSKIRKITISPGMTLDDVTIMLSENNLLANELGFKISVKLSGKENLIYSGTFYIKKGLSNPELAALLTTPDYVSLGGKGKVTFPEGFRIKQMGRLLQKEFDMSGEVFQNESANDSLINSIGLAGKIQNLEGFLFPETYIVPIDANEKHMVRILFDEFLEQVYYNPEIQKYAEENPERLLNLIILASIVQAETGVQEELPVIAGVYKNRLQRNIKLQADPTIQYILPEGPRRLLNKDYKIESPYNTYLHNGLPPGPVNNPGLDAIIACLNPAQHDYLFFVAKKDKTHKFSKTYEEHLKAIKEIRGY